MDVLVESQKICTTNSPFFVLQAVSETPIEGDVSRPYCWEERPNDLCLPGQGLDPELNGDAIKERLMANRLPESCV